MSNTASVIGRFTRPLIRPVKSVWRWIETGGTVTSVVPVCSRDFWKLLRRARRLCKKESFVLHEIKQMGLLDTEMTDKEIEGLISNKNMVRILRRLNPVPWAEVTHNKAVTQAFLEGGGIPNPRLYAIFCRDSSGWTSEGSHPRTCEQWRRFIDKSLPDEFIVKPTEGSLGEGVELYRRRNGGFVDCAGDECTWRDIHDSMAGDSDNDSYIIQERLRNHAELVRLSGAESLQTVRFISLIDSSGRPRILQALLKFVGNGNLTDNFECGMTGNIEAPVDLESGRLTPAVTGCSGKRLREHPETGRRFEDFKVPCWSDACDIVLHGSKLLAPSRSLGWDIAITPRGPVVVEINTWWGPPNYHPNVDELLEALNALETADATLNPTVCRS